MKVILPCLKPKPVLACFSYYFIIILNPLPLLATFVQSLFRLVLIYFVACTMPSWMIGDGFCQDLANNEVCEWDGGDCCGNNVNSDYCNDCECLDPTFN